MATGLQGAGARHSTCARAKMLRHQLAHRDGGRVPQPAREVEQSGYMVTGRAKRECSGHLMGKRSIMADIVPRPTGEEEPRVWLVGVEK